MAKKIICLLICAITLFSLAFIGCGKTDDSGNNSENSSSSDSSSGLPDGDSSSSGGDSSQSGTPDPKPSNDLQIVAPKGMVYSCKDSILPFLKADESEDVAKYAISMNDQAQSVIIEWTDGNADADSYTVEYGLKNDYSDAVIAEVDGSSRRLKVFNLLKASTYYFRVTAIKEGEDDRVAEGSFSTQTIGPRVMKIGGIINVRDVGGYVTEGGKTVKQGLVFRGSCLSPSVDPAFKSMNLTDEGKKYMSETLKIKSDFDLRWDKLYPELTESPIPGAKITFFGISGYEDAFTDTYKENYRKLFSMFADKNNYPIYVHCDAGADRTGTAMMILEYLLDMKWEDIKRDYEFTTFSLAGLRSSMSGPYLGHVNSFTEGLLSYEGDTYAKKAENYLLSIGVTAAEIASIRSIMYGETQI